MNQIQNYYYVSYHSNSVSHLNRYSAYRYHKTGACNQLGLIIVSTEAILTHNHTSPKTPLDTLESDFGTKSEDKKSGEE